MKIMIAISVLLSTTSNAQIKNAKTESVKIYGNCECARPKSKKQETLKK